MRTGDWITHPPRQQCLLAGNRQVKGYVYYSVWDRPLRGSITKNKVRMYKVRMYMGHFRLTFGFRIWGIWSPVNLRETLYPSILFLCYFGHIITHTCSQKHKSSHTRVHTDAQTCTLCNSWRPNSAWWGDQDLVTRECRPSSHLQQGGISFCFLSPTAY